MAEFKNKQHRKSNSINDNGIQRQILQYVDISFPSCLVGSVTSILLTANSLYSTARI